MALPTRRRPRDGVTPVLVLDLSRALSDPVRWASLVPRLRLASQLTHPSAKRILELGLEQESSLRGAGMGRRNDARDSHERRAARVGAGDPRADSCRWPACSRRRIAWVLLMAGLGLDQVFLTAEGQVKLDFSGASVGFPRDGMPSMAPGASENRAGDASLAALRSADLYGLGVLIAWLDRGEAAAPGEDPLRITTREDSMLGTLARAHGGRPRRPPARA